MADALEIGKEIRLLIFDNADELFFAAEVSDDIDYLFRDHLERCVQSEFGLKIGENVYTVTVKESRF